ncbi:hypothetical protein BJ508DRAFT_412185 [Ascobolus immersus RN42]|uniref:Uncharacterized protein n=1 Tax=Ascobolus immersus RN42 TaxID=1160509 RepID=A0A3N4IIE9_ASCIM|nr:hypothetical protein BJ508DRAFT_412185 [Ascobolus immersus RN42]
MPYPTLTPPPPRHRHESIISDSDLSPISPHPHYPLPSTVILEDEPISALSSRPGTDSNTISTNAISAYDPVMRLPSFRSARATSPGLSDIVSPMSTSDWDHTIRSPVSVGQRVQVVHMNPVQGEVGAVGDAGPRRGIMDAPVPASIPISGGGLLDVPSAALPTPARQASPTPSTAPRTPEAESPLVLMANAIPNRNLSLTTSGNEFARLDPNVAAYTMTPPPYSEEVLVPKPEVEGYRSRGGDGLGGYRSLLTGTRRDNGRGKRRMLVCLACLMAVIVVLSLGLGLGLGLKKKKGGTSSRQEDKPEVEMKAASAKVVVENDDVRTKMVGNMEVMLGTVEETDSGCIDPVKNEEAGIFGMGPELWGCGLEQNGTLPFRISIEQVKQDEPGSFMLTLPNSKWDMDVEKLDDQSLDRSGLTGVKELYEGVQQYRIDKWPLVARNGIGKEEEYSATKSTSKLAIYRDETLKVLQSTAESGMPVNTGLSLDKIRAGELVWICAFVDVSLAVTVKPGKKKSDGLDVTIREMSTGEDTRKSWSSCRGFVMGDEGLEPVDLSVIDIWTGKENQRCSCQVTGKAVAIE